MMALLASTAIAATAGDVRPARFVAAFENGDYVTGPKVTDWARPGGTPRLKGRWLTDPANHVRWLCDTSLAAAAMPAAFVEFHSGDRLPGEVSSASADNGEPSGLSAPPYLVVDLGARLKNSRNTNLTRLRIARRMVRRIVWKARGANRYEPGTLRRRNGRTLRFLEIRFGKDSVTLLLDRGTAEVLFKDIAELHLRQTGSWDTYFDELAALSPGLDARLFQLETTTGVIATASTGRFRAMPYSDRDNPERWYHLIHPAWSLDAFAVRCGEVRVRCYFRPQEVPLTRIRPTRVENRSVISSVWPCQVNRNVLGGPLQSGGRLYGWGFGVHGDSRLQFPLPPIARTFRTRVGIDRHVGAGGCVRTKVLLNESAGTATPRGKSHSTALHTSDVLVGSQETADTGLLRLPLNRNVKGRGLVLSVDPMNFNGPKGADPLDIRDTLDWLEPTVELDRKALAAEVRRRLVQCIPAWRGWSLDKGQADQIQLLGHWDALPSQGANYRFAVRPGKMPLVLRRTVTVGASGMRLAVAATRLPDVSDPAVLEVRVEGKQVARRELPVRRTGEKEPPPLTVPLDRWSGRRVRLEIALAPKDPKAARLAIDWRGIVITGGERRAAPSDGQSRQDG